jgi:translation initiation factor 5
MSHKLCTFILAQDKKDKKSKKEKSKDRNKDKKESDEKEKRKNKKEKKKKEKKEKLGKNPNENFTFEGKRDEVYFSDCTPDTSVFRVKNNYDCCGAIDMAVLEIQKFMKENVAASSVRIAEEVTNQQISYAVNTYQKIHIFVCAAISRNFYKEHLAKKYAPIIHIITQGNPIMERHLISAAEFICSEKTKNFQNSLSFQNI